MVLLGFNLLRFFRGIWRATYDVAFRSLFVSAVFTLLLGMFFYHFTEDWGYLDSLYFSVITLTTVGYGDLAPETALGKIFTMFYVLTGIGIIVAFVTTMGSRRRFWFGTDDESENGGDSS